MPIRYSSIVGGGGTSGFNLDVGTSGNTTFYFDQPQPAGGYSITSQLADSTIEFYAIAEDGTLAGYTNTKALTTTKDFDTIVVYGATNNDLITFEFKETIDPTASGDQDSGAAPFITSVSDADLGNIDDTTIITGGNFATNVTVTFTGTDNVIRNAKSVVRTNSTQLIVTRPDAFLQNNSPYTLTVANPGITQSAIRTNTFSITAGGDPTWVTASGTLSTATVGQAYSTTLSATDPDGGAITYSLVTGSLPTGLSLNSSTGVISGTPTGGSQTFTIAAADPSGNITNRNFSIVVSFATGGTVTDIPGYRVHTFTSNGTFTSLGSISNLEYLIVAGGGGGGNTMGGGGGAGGMLTGSLTLSSGTYPIVVGSGGNGATNRSTVGGSGTNSSFNSVVAFGGGGGASWDSSAATSGGSGGGGPNGKGGAVGTNGQGNSGGGSVGNGTGGGGGGAGGSGFGGSATGSAFAGRGGAGVSSLISGTSTFYAGGGGGGGSNGGAYPVTDSQGGSSVGGNGGLAAPGSNAVINRGGGGGGGGYPGDENGGSGSTGVVIIRYSV